MSGNTRFFNRIFYIQRYYDIFDEAYFWRFWIFGFYATSRRTHTQTTKPMKVITLKWIKLGSQFADGYLSEIPGINSQYSIGTDRTTGRVYLTGLDRTRKDYKTFHSSFDEAKAAAQIDFEKIVQGLIQNQES